MKEIIEILSQERLMEIFHYDPSSGLFTRLVSTSNNVRVGDVVGCRRRDGYLTASIDGRLYLLHQLAWLYVHGRIPCATDHIDRNRANNSILNLRECTPQENNWNQNVKITNKSGIKGVSWDSTRGKWFVSIRVNGRTKPLGRYDDIEKAAAAYQEAAIAYRGHFLGAAA